jgi:hypothetical protein
VEIEADGEKIPKGAEGTVVSVYRGGEGYAVEFESATDGMSVVTVYPSQIIAVS